MRGSRGRVLAGVVCGVTAMVGAGGVAHAQERFNPRVGLATTGPYYRATVAVRLNPIGLFGDFRAGYRLRLFNSPTRHILLRNTYIALAASVVASPAFVRPGIALEIQPIQMLNLQVLYEPVVQWFGSFSNLQTYPTAGQSGIGAGIVASGNNPPDATNAQSARGWQLTLQGTLQARIGQTLAVRDTFRAVRSSYDTSTLAPAHQGDRVYYDPFYDVVAPLDGWVFTNDLDVIASLTDLGTNIGLRYTSVIPQLGDGDDANRTTTTHRLGPIVTYTFKEQRHAAFNAPTVFVLAQWWLHHQFRTGGDSPGTISQYMPMIVMGFSFRGDW
jgi:hypothetical protein